MKKTCYCLLMLYGFQLLSSCLACPELEYFEITYEGVEFSLFDLEDRSNSEIQRENLVGSVKLITEQTQTDGLSFATPFSINSAYALEECESRLIKYNDSFAKIELILVQENDSDSTITDAFFTRDFLRHRISLQDFIDSNFPDYSGYDRQYRADIFNIYAYNANNLPENFKIKIVLTLKTGAVFETISDHVVLKLK